ncbi:MAG: adenylate/guanylate cyclase domain-containing protein [Ilumatobacteraceae bacterium]
MVCTACQHDNQPNAKFCSECGASIARPCPTCGHQQLSTAKFCDECGTSLTAAPPTGPTPVRAAARKRVTALFADLVGSTAFAERLDAEAVRAGLAPYFDLLQSTIDDHAGSVVKFLGDGVFALFGVPEVAEDDALRAVTAGIDLQRRFRSFADGIRGRHDVELGLRVGVNTGELVVGSDDVDLVGDVLNTAARLEAACEPGHVLVGEDTWRLTRSSVSYEVLGGVRVKGKVEPVATFQVVEEGAGVADEVTPFVGRTSELDTLRSVFDDAVASSVALLVTVIGDPGVGKTRLAQELRAGTQARSFDLRLERRGSTTFAPIADLLREVTGSGSVDDVERLVDGHPEATRLGPVLASFLGHSEQRTTEESFWAVRRFLELLAADGPVIVVVDDIQWAEPLFWELLDHLVEWTAAPVLLIALARPELRELRPELAQSGRRVSASIALEGLDAGTTLELAARLLGIEELPPELAERLPASTEGNPLFVRELVLMLVDDGVLARDGDRWRLTIDADAIEVPPTILSLLASRVERLPDDERQLVELASVVGSEFDRGTLIAIAPADLAGRLGGVIDRLRRKDLVEPTGQWAGDHPVYRFHHVLIRDAAYRRLLKGHRAELHERVGRHVETTGIADDERDVIVAHHFEQVLQYRSDLGTVDDHTRELAVEAAARLRSAAEQSLGREDLASAGGAAIRALRLLDSGAGAERDELLLIGCEALLSSADVTRGAPLVDDLHSRATNGRLAAWADCFRAQLWSLTAADRVTEAGELAADAADRLAAIGDQAGVAKARLVRAGCLARLGRVGDCEAELDLALGAARAAGDRRRTVAVLGAAPLAALWGPSPVARAGGRCLDVLRLLRITTASPTVEATSIRCQGMLEALRGRDDAARAKFETSRAIARELGLQHALYETELFAGLAELLTGNAVEAEPHLRAAHEGLGRLGIGADAGQAAALLARSLLLQGRVADADELATSALATAGQNLQTAIAARAVLAEVRATQGNHDDARALVDEALSIVAPTDVTLDHALTLLAAARVAVAAGGHVEAARRQTQANEVLTSKGVSLRFDAAPNPVPVGGPPPNLDSARSEQTRPRIWNHALEIAHRSTELATAGDREGFLACYAPDFTTVEHGGTATVAGYDGRVGADTWADFALWVMAQSEGSVGEPDPIAIRGDRHALMRWTLRSPTTSFERLVVIAADGVVLRRAHFYDHDQLVEAIDDLERQWVEHDPSAIPYSTLTAGSRANWAVATGNPDAMHALLTADFVAVDHRQVGLGERHLDDWVESNDMSATGRPFLVIATEILAGDDGRCLARLAASVGDDTWHVLSLMEVRDGLVSRIEHFDEADIDAAAARYQELAPRGRHRRAFTNTALEISQLATEAFQRRDADSMRALLAPDFRAVWHERLAETPLEADRETFVDVLFEIDGRGDPRRHEVRPLALRGDHLALAWTRVTVEGAEQWVRYRVNETVGRQQMGVEWFDEDQLDEAVAALDRRWIATCGVPSDSVVVRAWPMTRSTRAGDIAEFVHQEFEYTDHCRLRTDEHGGDLDEFVRRGWVEPETWSLVTNVHRFDESGAVYERVEYNDGNEIWLVWVAQQADGAMRRLDRFDHDDLDAAIALFDSRRATSPQTRRALSNTASRLADDLAARAAGDRERLLAVASPDFVIRAHGRWSTSFPELSREELAEALGPDRGESELPTVVAIRGDHLCLVRNAGAAGGGRGEGCFVVESDDSHVTSIDWYDSELLDEATAELDRRYLISQGLPAEHWVVEHWHRAYGTSFDDFAPILHPEFVMTDHRRIVGGPGGGVDHLHHVLAVSAGASRITLPRILRVSNRGAVYEHLETTLGEGDSVENLMVLGFVDELICSVDLYDAGHPDDEFRALARYDEIVGKPAHERPPNRGYRIADEFGRASIRRDRDAMLELLADDFEFDHRGRARASFDLRADRTSFVDALRTIVAEEGVAAMSRSLVATRGDDLYLAKSGSTTADGDELHVYALGESDGTRIRRMTYFDESQSQEAVDTLGRRYRLACGIGDDHWIATNWAALTSFDADRYEEFLAADFLSVDHRSIALGVVGRAEFLEWLRVTPTAASWSIPAIHRLSGRGMVVEHMESWADGAGVTRMLLVADFGDHQTRRVDAYEPDDLDAALARYDEISGASRRPLTNDAWESARRRRAAQSRQDRAEFAALYDAGFAAQFHDPRTTAVHDTAQFDKPGFMELVLHPDMTSEGAGSEMELVAIRGDDLCLYRVGMISPDGDRTERLIVDAVHDGRCTRMDVFDPDQLLDAQLELDRWYRRACGIDDDHWLAGAARTPYTTDFTSLAWFLHPDFEYVERRPLAWPSGHADSLREYMATYGNVPELIIPTVHRLSERGLVYERLETADDHAVTDVIMVCHFQDERLRRLIAYELEDLDRALAEFDAYVARRSSRTLTNRAWEIAEDAQRVRVSGDRDRFASFFAEDFVVTSHDSVMAQVTGGAYDRALWLEAAFDPLVFGPTSSQDLELIAVRGDDHCLFRSLASTRSGDLHERLNVLEVRNGLAVDMEVFAHHQLREAQMELDRRYRRARGFGDVRWMAEEGSAALYATDFADIEPLLHPVFEYVEHRPLSFPDGDAVDVQRAFEALPVEWEVIVPVVHRLSEHGMVCVRLDRYHDGSTSEQVHVSHFEDGRLRRLLVYELDDLGRALAEFDTFVARREAGERLTNAAWELAQNAIRAHRVGDRDRFASCLTDDFTGTAHDPIMASVDADGTIFDRTLFVEASFDPLLYGPGSTGDVELIAVRGDESCLFRIRTTSTEGDVNERIHGLEVREGLGVRWDSYGGDQLRQAQIELDRCWLASLGFDEGDWVVQHWDLVYGITFDEFEDILHDDFEFVDHRPLHFPSGGADALSTTMRSLSHDVEVLVLQVHRISPSGGVFERIERAVGDVLGEEHMIVVSHITNGTLRRLESYTVDDLASALARYDELTATAHPQVPPLTNRAWKIAEAFNAAYVAGDRDAIDRLVDSDGPVEHRVRLSVVETGTVRDFVDHVLSSHAEATEKRQQLELVAVRGEHHCLVVVDGWYDAANLRNCLVVETDAERVTHMVWFDDDQLVDAQLELDRRWLASIGYADHWFEPIRLVMYDPHPDAMFEHLAPDFEYDDHRPLMFPSGDAEVLRSTIHSLQYDVVFTIPRIHRISDAGSVIERIETAVGDIGQTHVVFVSQFVDQRVQRMEAFDITQLDQALARFDELTAGNDPRPDEESE